MSSATNSLLTSKGLWLGARIFLVIVFLSSGLAKLIDFQGGMEEMRGAGLSPEWLFNVLTIATLLVGSALILIDRALWLGACALSVFLVLTIIVVHHFWSLPEPKAMLSMFVALEHLSLIGGLIAASIASALHKQLSLKN